MTQSSRSVVQIPSGPGSVSKGIQQGEGGDNEGGIARCRGCGNLNLDCVCQDPAALAAKLKKLINTLGKYFQLCQRISANQGEPCWHITPKTHSTCHIPKQAALINPVKVQNYMEESLVGKVAEIWHGCASGTYHSTVQHTALFKYILGLFLDLGVPLNRH